MGAELFDADGRTDRQTERHDEAKFRFSQLCNTPKKWKRNDPTLAVLRSHTEKLSTKYNAVEEVMVLRTLSSFESTVTKL